MLIIQLVAGIFSVVKDNRYVFSNSYKVNELLAEVPAGEKTVTDYWALNAIAAFADKPFYCIDIEKEIPFVLWNRELGEALRKKSRYLTGITNYFEKEKISKVYMLSIGSPAIISRVDPQLATSYHVVLVDKREGAIEKAGNLYLYEISRYQQ